ncbi:hypothetical protein [uncultured Halomonas sp.]|uniref:hypothetical protein n=1 Tax=uncultured Halomonas sp. TaxID=173971 RepID=UPI0026033BF5|nr:hypothetical protein [uncultured Halomonas sp.]
MAFSEIAPGDATALTHAICDFAQYDLGWGRSGLDVTPPGGASGFRLSTIEQQSASSVSSYGRVSFDTILVELINYALPPGMTYDDVPDPIGSCNWLTPISRAWLFGGTDPEHWLHVVVETAPGYFHHLYFGRLERYGNWGGGAIFSATNWGVNSSSSRRWDGGFDRNNYGPLMLFQAARQDGNGFHSSFIDPGFVEVDHPEAPMPVFRFVTSDRQSQPCVTGGFGTAYNGLLTAIPRNGFDGSVPTQPIILFHLDEDQWSRPLGRVSGVRMINMTSFSDSDVVEFAGDTYQVFPLGTRRVGYGEHGMDGHPGTAPVGPGVHTPRSSNGRYYFSAGMGTEFWGVAVRRESEMTTFPGIVAPAGPWPAEQPERLSSSFDVAALTRWTALHWHGHAEHDDPGTLLDVQPTTPSGVQTYPGAIQHTTLDDFYNRIWVTPRLINVGAITGAVSRNIEVWNAYLTEHRTLTDIDQRNSEGITLLGPDRPVEFAPLQAFIFTAEIGSDGPARIDARFELLFTTPEGEPSFSIVG